MDKLSSVSNSEYGGVICTESFMFEPLLGKVGWSTEFLPMIKEYEKL